MASFAQSQGATSSRRNSASLNPTPALSRPPPHRSNSVTPEDDYTYNDVGPSVSPTNPKQRSGDPSSEDISQDPERFTDELRTNIYEKAISGNRAKLPDDFDRADGNLTAPSGQPTVPAAANTPFRRRRRDFFGMSRPPVTGRVPRSAEKTILRKVELHWSRKEVEGVEKVSLNACVPDNDALKGSENSVLWQ